MESKRGVLNVYFFLSLLLTVCSLEPSKKSPESPGNSGVAVPPLPPIVETDYRIKPFLAEWETLNGPITTSIVMVEIPEEGVLGICYRYTNREEVITHIELDTSSFNREFELDWISPKIIVFHELGHCELGRPHLGDFGLLFGEQIPFSIMFPALWPDTKVYKNLYETHYIDELFGGPGSLERVTQRAGAARLQTINLDGYEVTIIVN